MANTLIKTSNQTIGRGRVLFKKTGESGYRDLGNCPDFAFSTTSETLKHFDSRSGVQVQDKEIVIRTEYGMSFTMDSINHENLAMLLLGTAATVAVAGATGETFSFTDVTPGYTYDLGGRNVANVVVTGKTVDVDYTVDAARGHIVILESGTITAGSTVAGTYDITAHSYDRTQSGGEAVEGTMLFIANNPEGDDVDYVIPDIKVTPNGDFNVKAQEWQSMSMQGAISVLDDGTPAITANGQPYTPA